MKIGTRKFGEIEIDETKILTMPGGLPGFDGYEKFALLEDPKTAPFCWFQSVDEPNLALVIMDPFVFMPDYDIGLDNIIKNLKWNTVAPEDVLIFVVVNIFSRNHKNETLEKQDQEKQDQEKKITANLVGPIVINPKDNTAVQVVLSDTTYSCQYNILAPEETE